MKMRISQSAKNYSDALIDLDLANDVTLVDMVKIEEVLNSSKELCETLNNPTLNTEVKIAILNDIFKGKINDKIYEFLVLLIKKNRIKQFSEIFTSYKKKLHDIQNIKEVEIMSAIELSDEYKKKIITKLENKLNKRIIPNWQISTDIIGGLVIKIDDTLIDTSLKNKIENLSKVMK